MRHRHFLIALSTLCISGIPYAQAGLLGPTPYVSFADSPFYGSTYDYFYLEDFEDGSLNTPGVTSTGGFHVSPTPNTDSVDADDGVIDGFGRDGHSYYSGSGGTTMTFTFNQTVLGQLPTLVGAVWTDVGGFSDYSGYVTLRAYDVSNALIGTVGPFLVGDHSASGTTAEDRFLGISGTTGIKRMTLSMDGGDWEMDHLQYGVPEPSMAALLGLGALCLLTRRNRSIELYRQ
jgi:hypothetical protein